MNPTLQDFNGKLTIDGDGDGGGGGGGGGGFPYGRLQTLDRPKPAASSTSR